MTRGKPLWAAPWIHGELRTLGIGILDSGMQHIILDRDPPCPAAFRRLLRDSGVTLVVLAACESHLKCVCSTVRRIGEIRVLGQNGAARQLAAANGCTTQT